MLTMSASENDVWGVYLDACGALDLEAVLYAAEVRLGLLPFAQSR